MDLSKSKSMLKKNEQHLVDDAKKVHFASTSANNQRRQKTTKPKTSEVDPRKRQTVVPQKVTQSKRLKHVAEVSKLRDCEKVLSETSLQANKMKIEAQTEEKELFGMSHSLTSTFKNWVLLDKDISDLKDEIPLVQRAISEKDSPELVQIESVTSDILNINEKHDSLNALLSAALTALEEDHDDDFSENLTSMERMLAALSTI